MHVWICSNFPWMLVSEKKAMYLNYGLFGYILIYSQMFEFVWGLDQSRVVIFLFPLIWNWCSGFSSEEKSEKKVFHIKGLLGEGKTEGTWLVNVGHIRKLGLCGGFRVGIDSRVMVLIDRRKVVWKRKGLNRFCWTFRFSVIGRLQHELYSGLYLLI